MEAGTPIGPYRIEELIGRGGMAEVYKVWHNNLHRYEALKLLPSTVALDSAFVRRFLEEACVAARLHHPHIVTIHSVSEGDGPPYYFSMQLVEGGDLADLLNARHRLTLREALPILRQIASALDHAHRMGVVHRDIKPPNILLESDDPHAVHRSGFDDPEQAWNVKVVDFGIARAMGEAGTTRLTHAGMFVGTPEYMSPEQAGSGAAIDGRTDIYSLGVIAYEMLCGRPPFRTSKDTSPLAVVIKHLNDNPPSPREFLPTLPEATCEVLIRALAKDPQQRFASCSIFIEALAATANFGSSEGDANQTVAAIASAESTPAVTVNGTAGATAVGETSHKASDTAQNPSIDSEGRPLTINSSLVSLFNEPAPEPETSSPPVPPAASVYEFPVAGNGTAKSTPAASKAPAPEAVIAEPAEARRASRAGLLVLGGLLLCAALGAVGLVRNRVTADPDTTVDADANSGAIHNLTPPRVLIGEPASGSTLAPGALAASGEAQSSGSSISGVAIELECTTGEKQEQLVHGQWQAIAANGSSAPAASDLQHTAQWNAQSGKWFWKLPVLTPGDYRLTAIAKDARGQSSESTATFTVEAKSPPKAIIKPVVKPIKPAPAKPAAVATPGKPRPVHRTSAPPITRVRRVRRAPVHAAPRRVRRAPVVRRSRRARSHASTPRRSVPRPSAVPRPGASVPRPE
jgi:serine/threonine-protein kinase